MKTRYLTLKYVEPIKVEFKDGTDLLNIIADYLDCYGDCFLGLMDTYEDAIQEQELHYIMFGDVELCQDLMTIYHLEHCLKLEVNK